VAIGPVPKAVTDRVVNALAFASVGFLVVWLLLQNAHRFADDNVRFGDLVRDLALAYLAAWIFNVLVVVLPRRHDQRRIYAGSGHLIQMIAGTGIGLIGTLAEAAGADAPSQPDREFVARICAHINPNDQAPLVTGFPAPGQFTYASWLGYVEDSVNRARNAYSELGPMFVYFDAELIARLNGVVLSILRMVTEMAKWPIRNEDMSAFAPNIASYWELCHELNTCFEAQVKPHLAPRR
jgi:hypothetical protein